MWMCKQATSHMMGVGIAAFIISLRIKCRGSGGERLISRTILGCIICFIFSFGYFEVPTSSMFFVRFEYQC